MIFNILAGIAFALAALCLWGGFWLAKSRDAHIRRARSWPTVMAEVLSSELKERGEVDSPLIRYRYTVGDQTLESDNVQFGAWAGAQAEGQALVDRTPAGSVIPVHVNPEDPHDVVMLTSSNSGNYRLAGGICAAGLTAVGVAFIFMR